MKYNLITILGPTAVGKTRLAARLAHKFNGEIISADSRQVYKGMDIGTGKDLSDYTVEGKTVSYHLIDVVNPSEEYNLFLFKQNFQKIFNEIISRRNIPFLVGGTGLYLRSILKDYKLSEADFNSSRFQELNGLDENELSKMLKEINPNLHNTTDLLVKERIIKAIIISENNSVDSVPEKNKISSLVIGVNLDRDKVKKRITDRLKHRLQDGMIDEVKNLLREGITYERLELFGLEYKFIAKHLKGELNYNDMYQKLNSAIHSFAKRQMTWFRKMEKEGIVINWIDGPDYNAAEQIINNNYFGKS